MLSAPSAVSQWLPVLAAALLPAALADALAVRSGLGRGPRLAIAVLIVAIMLAPLGDLSLAGRLRGFLGDASMSAVALLLLYFSQAFGPAAWREELRRQRPQLTTLAVLLLLVAAVFYPLSMGLGWADPYSAGYYPSVLSALLLTLFCIAAFSGWWLSAGLLAIAYFGFAGSWLGSSNLWDYLFDVPLCLVALGWVMTHRDDLKSHSRHWFTPARVTTGVFILIGVFLLFALVLSHINPQDFTDRFAVEDGFVEWSTSIALFIAFLVSVRRFIRSQHRFKFAGKLILLFIAFVCIFGAGEEISWGQRVFGIETPESFKERNAQEEFNLHNLTFEWKGETIKINKLIFGRGLTLALLTYLFVMGPLYRRHAGFRRFIDRLAIPIATWPQTIAYLVVVAFVETLIDSPKRGEITEFAGAIVFLLNIAFPYNRAIYGEGDADDPPDPGRLAASGPAPAQRRA